MSSYDDGWIPDEDVKSVSITTRTVVTVAFDDGTPEIDLTVEAGDNRVVVEQGDAMVTFSLASLSAVISALQRIQDKAR